MNRGSKSASPVAAVPESTPASNLSARITSRISTSKVLLLAADPAHCLEVAEGWRLAQCHTWSRVRHKSNAGQDPLRSRSLPRGIPSLSPDAQSKVLLDNVHFKYAAWILECSQVCERANVGSILLFLEDPGGHHGPASVWQLREFQVLECDHDARRGAGFLCQLAHAEQKRPLGILTTLAALHSDLCMGWPKFVLDQNDLRYVGPLPRDCGCLAQHSPMLGQNTDEHFYSSISPTLGPLFWKRVWKAKAE